MFRMLVLGFSRFQVFAASDSNTRASALNRSEFSRRRSGMRPRNAGAPHWNGAYRVRKRRSFS